MSNWTHVAGVFRIDAIRMLDEVPDFDELIGKVCVWDDADYVWDDFDANPSKYLPAGSEGTLNKSVWINPNIESIDSYTVTVFGDLRGDDDPNAIVEWFKRKCDEIDNSKVGWIRNAVIVADNERNGQVTWAYEETEE